MATGPIQIARQPIPQPNRSDTKKSQKRGALGDEYEGQIINTELDYIHERVNQVIREDAPLPNLDPATATLPEAITMLNSIAETLRSAGLLRRE